MPRRQRAYGMRLLRTIIRPQRWGIATVVPARWTIAFKGGWGSGTGAVDHQVGLLRLDGDRIAVAVLTVANPSHAYGEATEAGVARRMLRGLPGRLVGTVRFGGTNGSRRGASPAVHNCVRAAQDAPHAQLSAISVLDRA